MVVHVVTKRARRVCEGDLFQVNNCRFKLIMISLGFYSIFGQLNFLFYRVDIITTWDSFTVLLSFLDSASFSRARFFSINNFIKSSLSPMNPQMA